MIRQKLARFLYGRNGPDTIYNVCIWTAFGIAILNMFLRLWPLDIVYFLLFGYAIFRLLSRNIARRQAENQAFRRFFARILAGPLRTIELWKRKRSDRTHVYKRCPNCKSQLRFPREKGEHTVRCPRCGGTFSVKI